jgi:hypothetical protein
MFFRLKPKMKWGLILELKYHSVISIEELFIKYVTPLLSRTLLFTTAGESFIQKPVYFNIQKRIFNHLF